MSKLNHIESKFIFPLVGIYILNFVYELVTNLWPESTAIRYYNYGLLTFWVVSLLGLSIYILKMMKKVAYQER